MKQKEQNQATDRSVFALKTLSFNSFLVASLFISSCGNGNITVEDLETSEATTSNSTAEASATAQTGNDFSQSQSGNDVVAALLTASSEPVTAAALPESVTSIAEQGALTEAESLAEAETEPVVEAEPEPVVEAEPEPVVEAEPSTATLPEQSPLESDLQVSAINPNLPPVQCLQFPSQPLGINEVSSNNWRNWVSPLRLRYSQLNEFVEVNEAFGKNSMRITMEPASNGTARVGAAADLPSRTAYRLSQSIFLEPGYEWGRRFEGGKLGFGLGGGSAPTGGQIQTDGFTARFIWRGNKDGTAHMAVYSYASDRTQNPPYGDDHPLAGFNVPVGEWFDLVLEVTANSEIDKADGTLKAWANGQQLVNLDNVHWQSSGNKPAIQQLSFASFYGGGTIEWAPLKTTYLRIADVCWAPVLDGESSLDPSARAESIFDQFVPPQNDGEPLPLPIRTSLRAQLADILLEVELELPVIDDHITWALNIALESLTRTLDSNFWLDDNTISGANLAGEHLNSAIHHFEIATFSPGITPYMWELLSTSILDLKDIRVELGIAE